MVKLAHCIEDLREKHPDAFLFIRGDANVNPRDKNRNSLLNKLCNDQNLIHTNVDHPTYHHFLGQGSSDSQLDIILHSPMITEVITSIICNRTDPLVTSHHDALLSHFSLPKLLSCPPQIENPLAPRVANDRVKILWNKLSVEAYEKYVGTNLARLRSSWLDPGCSPSISILLQSTNSFLDFCARETNAHSSLLHSS